MAPARAAASHAPRLLRILAAVSACVLIALAAAYYLTYEPAPRIGVVWRDGISADRQRELERRFLLVNPGHEDDDSILYDLLDTSRENVRALIFEPDVADTDRVSRPRYEVPFDIPYGQSWMWIAHRTPVLRIPGVVPGLVAICALLLAAGLVSEWRRWRR